MSTNSGQSFNKDLESVSETRKEERYGLVGQSSKTAKPSDLAAFERR